MAGLETDISRRKGALLELEVDLVVTARAKIAKEKVNGPEDSLVTETI